MPVEFWKLTCQFPTSRDLGQFRRWHLHLRGCARDEREHSQLALTFTCLLTYSLAALAATDVNWSSMWRAFVDKCIVTYATRATSEHNIHQHENRAITSLETTKDTNIDTAEGCTVDLCASNNCFRNTADDNREIFASLLFNDMC